MRLDSDIKRDVEDEPSWDPDLDAIDIGVTVHNGVVTLGGFVGSYAQKSQAKRVAGVVGVANDIEVRLPVVDERPDPEIVRDAVSALKSELPYRPEAVRRERKSASARTPLSFHPERSLRAGLQDRRRHNPTPNDGRFVAVIRS